MNTAADHNRLVQWLEQAALDTPEEQLRQAAARAFPGVTREELCRAALDRLSRFEERYHERRAQLLQDAIIGELARLAARGLEQTVADALQRRGWLDQATHAITAPPEVLAEATRRARARLGPDATRRPPR